ncbi:protein kinase [Cryptosporangium sp. NPDC048952]|uniref:protein kinase domain-containing protein n=1 Tax=Cryptosporangium sp. NPDC048952 TaxID=3363961 RepID=UPI00371DFEDC
MVIIDRAQLVAALPQYEVGEPIGRGAHGVVFTARHRRLGSTHAVKALMTVESDAVSASQRFLTEARVLTSLDHPHIVRVNEYAEHGMVLLLVMEFLGGGTLADRMGRAVDPGVASAWMLAVTEALSVAHRQGVVHRDIKPANLLFTSEGLLKVGDFGIAKLFAGTDASASVNIVGTPRYIAPEQIAGGRIGPATDLYALGATFYELLAGRSPFPSELPMPGLLHHHMTVPPRPMEGVPPALSALVLRLLEKDPGDRPESARDFAVELVRAADQDLGHDWIARSGVPLRIDSALLPREPAQAWRSAPTVSAAPAAGDPSPAGPPRNGPAWNGPTASAPPNGAASSGPDSGGAAGSGPPPNGLGQGGAADSHSPTDSGSRSGRKSRNILIVVAAAIAVLIVTGVSVLVANRDVFNASEDEPVVSSPAPSASATPGTGAPTNLLTFKADKGADRLAVNSTASQVAYVGSDGRAYVRSTKADGRVIGPLGGTATNVNDLAFAVGAEEPGGDDPARTPDGSEPLLTGGDFGDLKQWDPATGTQKDAAVSKGEGQVGAVAYSLDGRTMAGAADDGEVWVYESGFGDVNGDGPLRSPESEDHGHDVVAFSPDKKLVATAGYDGIHIWDLTSHKLERTIRNWTGDRLIVTMAFSPDGTRLAAGVVGQGVMIFDPSTGEQVGTLIDPGSQGGDVLTLGFNADGSQLSVFAGNTLTHWSADDAKPAGRSVTMHTRAVAKSATFNHTSAVIALGLANGEVQLWKVA